MRKVKKSKTFGRKVKRNSFGFTKFEIAKLELQDGDIIVLRTDQSLDRDQVQAVRDRAKEQFAPHRVIVLTCGLSLAIISDKRVMG
jgi:hypothetical protein